jgi:hypothetical protein
MPDWREFVKTHLGSLGLDPRREAEIVLELASHYDDICEDSADCRLPGDAALARASEEVRDWKAFRREIRRAELEEVAMNHRTKSLWLPGFVTGTLAWLLYPLFEAVGVHPRILVINNPPLFIFLPWMLALPFLGALGALGSRRTGGNSREMILAGIFPVLAMTVPFALISLVALTVDVIMRGNVPLSLLLSGLASAMLAWVVTPGAALLVGALPVALLRHGEPAGSSAPA